MTAGMVVFHNKTQKVVFCMITVGIDGAWLCMLHPLGLAVGPALLPPS